MRPLLLLRVTWNCVLQAWRLSPKPLLGGSVGSLSRACACHGAWEEWQYIVRVSCSLEEAYACIPALEQQGPGLQFGLNAECEDGLFLAGVARICRATVQVDPLP